MKVPKVGQENKDIEKMMPYMGSNMNIQQDQQTVMQNAVNPVQNLNEINVDNIATGSGTFA